MSDWRNFLPTFLSLNHTARLLSGTVNKGLHVLLIVFYFTLGFLQKSWLGAIWSWRFLFTLVWLFKKKREQFSYLSIYLSIIISFSFKIVNTQEESSSSCMPRSWIYLILKTDSWKKLLLILFQKKTNNPCLLLEGSKKSLSRAADLSRVRFPGLSFTWWISGGKLHLGGFRRS